MKPLFWMILATLVISLILGTLPLVLFWGSMLLFGSALSGGSK